MKAPHLAPALLALLIFAVSIAGGDLAAQRVEASAVHGLAPQVFDQKRQGSALQEAALQQPDILLILGSSELVYPNAYHASSVFSSYPTGFTVFPIDKGGAADLVFAEDLASLGSALKNKKVVISLTPSSFFTTVNAKYYAGNFSRLHANSLAFSTDLSLSLKQAASRRMLKYPDTLKSDPVLRFALEKLADGSPAALAEYYAVLPLGKMEGLILSLQDHWETVQEISTKRQLEASLSPDVPRQAANLDWPAMLQRATAQQQADANNNRFGFQNDVWIEQLKAQVAGEANSSRDAWFIQGLNNSAEWTDLDLVLQTLKELGAEPLLLSEPINGTYYDYLGVTRDARQAYYDRLERTAKRYGVQLIDYSEHDGDKYFLMDPWHISRVGWVYYDQALDAFYHSR